MLPTIELHDHAAQTRLNLARWADILVDAELAKLPYRIEIDRHGHIVMTPPPAFRHSRRQDHIIGLLHSLLPHGQTLPECPISTADGVKAIDVAWLQRDRPEILEDPIALCRAPEICIEILSPSKATAEIAEKRLLYFDAGALEVWICDLDGSISFYSGVDHQLPKSSLCPAFPRQIP